MNPEPPEEEAGVLKLLIATYDLRSYCSYVSYCIRTSMSFCHNIIIATLHKPLFIAKVLMIKTDFSNCALTSLQSTEMQLFIHKHSFSILL
jgi:hypothetical protein